MARHPEEPARGGDAAGAAWDPTQYLKFGDERSRPLADLLQRVPLEGVRRVVDLGCGPGTDTPLVHARWPEAHVHGVDNSPSMIEEARRRADAHSDYELADVRQWLRAAARGEGGQPAPELIVSNAAFQWIDGHRDFLPDIADLVAPGGVFAFQVPGNFDAPSHALLRQIAAKPEYARHVTEKLRDTVIRAHEYLADLSRPGWRVDAWETTYLHVLQGENPVFEWISATGARPVLNALPSPDKERFSEEYRAALRKAYRAEEHGTVMPFRRVFVVATRTAA